MALFGAFQVSGLNTGLLKPQQRKFCAFRIGTQAGNVRRGPGMSNSSIPMTVLPVGADPRLAHTRELLLLNHGCEVKTSLSKCDAEQLIQFLAIGPEELIAAIRDFAEHASEPSDQDGLVRGLLRVRLNAGQITCPHCQVPLVINSVIDLITKSQDCPSCKKAFLIVNDRDSRVHEA
jgi:hypothetical protein